MARILFAMAYPGYLRLYGTTVIGLASRGHEVLLAYDKTKTGHDEQPVPEGAPASVRAIGLLPQHGGRWHDAAIDLGCTIDYIRFLSRRDGTPYLRMRMEKYLPARFSGLRRIGSWPPWLVRTLAAASRAAERMIPVDAALVEYLRGLDPDVIVVTPLVARGPSGVQQTQVVKAARRAGIPVALAVGSWDHLSSKGLIRVAPDLVILWNETQKDEATRMHGVPADRVLVTGAQAFDSWFGRAPSLSRDAFLSRVQLPTGRPMLLYVGSSRGIAKPSLEVAFVRRWVTAIRAAADPAVRSASVLVRPHYSNMEAWSEVDFSDLPDVAIWPRQRPSLPMTQTDAADYFHSMHYSAAVVGINTSAMIESSIVGRAVFTVQVPEFASTQEGTTHFHYLLFDRDGCVESAPSFDAHVKQLGRALADPQYARDARSRFVARFVRPNGIDTPAVDYVVSAIERLTRLRSPRERTAHDTGASGRDASHASSYAGDRSGLH
jgi:hypothetical protein